MAELVLKIGAGANYQDGDTLEAFNERRIKGVHAEHLTNVMEMGFNSDGLRPQGCLADQAQCIRYQYKFVRVGRTTVKRQTLADGGKTVLSEEIIPQAEMDVEEFLRRRKKHNRHRIFGKEGAEWWYGGTEIVTTATVNSVWDEIETQTVERRNDSKFDLWPAGGQDLKSHLFIPTEDLTDEEVALVTRSVYQVTGQDENGEDITEMVHKRALNAEWKTAIAAELSRLGISQQDVEDKRVPVDLRRTMRRHDDADRPKLNDRETGKPVPRKNQ
jgi:hypothetical protein